MLLELRVENFAIMDNVAVEFGPGLNLLTGETGAGKSILIDALSLLLGEKASPEMIRHGAEKAVVSAVFETRKGAQTILENNGIDCQDEQIILRREFSSSGKGRVFINNQPATVGVLKQLAPELAAIHAQNETVLAFDASSRLRLLDRYAGIHTEELAAAFAGWRTLQERITELGRDEQDRLRMADLWSFQQKEIAAANLSPGEDSKLEQEKRVLANAEKLYAAAMSGFDALYDAESAAARQMRVAVKAVEDLARYAPEFQESLQQLESARLTAEDVGLALRDYAEGIEASPERLADIEERLAIFDRLKRKYGSTLDEVIRYGEELAGKLHEIENRDEVLQKLQRKLTAAAGAYLKLAREVSRKRYAAAAKLEKVVEAEINELAMQAIFRIQVGGSDEPADWSPIGFDRIAYMISTNAGEPLKPIEQIASGGELSRVMLALKASVEAGRATHANGHAARKQNALRCLVFDEIDAGIGGRAAEAVGRKLKQLARSSQALCITHLPQIASFADRHFVIEKKETAGRVRTAIRSLDRLERTEEIARMLSGAKLTDTSLKHAEQMLKANA